MSPAGAEFMYRQTPSSAIEDEPWIWQTSRSHISGKFGIHQTVQRISGLLQILKSPLLFVIFEACLFGRLHTGMPVAEAGVGDLEGGSEVSRGV